MGTLTEQMWPTESLVSEAEGTRSREAITVKSGNNVKACAVLGKVQTGTPVVAAGAAVSGSGGTVGNGSIGTPTVDAGAMAGTWQVVITNPATNAGAFEVRKPDGTVDGVGTVAVAYNGGINFTLADGTNDWVEDDYIPVTVTYESGGSVPKYANLNTAGTDGSQVAAAISYGAYDGTSADVAGVAFVRDCEHNADIVVWPSGITADQKAVAIAQLASNGIILR